MWHRSANANGPPEQSAGHWAKLGAERRSAAGFRAYPGRRVRMPAGGRILIGRLVMLIFARRVRPRLGSDRGRVGMLCLVRIVTDGRLVVLIVPNRVAAGLRINRLGGRGDWRRGSR